MLSFLDRGDVVCQVDSSKRRTQFVTERALVVVKMVALCIPLSVVFYSAFGIKSFVSKFQDKYSGATKRSVKVGSVALFFIAVIFFPATLIAAGIVAVVSAFKKLCKTYKENSEGIMECDLVLLYAKIGIISAQRAAHNNGYAVKLKVVEKFADVKDSLAVAIVALQKCNAEAIHHLIQSSDGKEIKIGNFGKQDQSYDHKLAAIGKEMGNLEVKLSHLVHNEEENIFGAAGDLSSRIRAVLKKKAYLLPQFLAVEKLEKFVSDGFVLTSPRGNVDDPKIDYCNQASGVLYY